MINLLPPTYRAGLRFARTNTQLRRWLIFGLAACGGMLVILGMGWLFINHQISNLNSSIADTKNELSSQNLTSVQKQADQISQNLRLINQVLAREINFSALMQDIGKVIPPGTVLSSLDLSNATGGIDLSANAKDYASAAQIAANLSDPKNNIFSKVDIVSITCNGVGPYPCAAAYRALFNSTAANHYLNAPKGGG